jgi:hypothetical protein
MNSKEIDILKECYIDKKMSTPKIEKESEKIFGKYINRGKIYRFLIENGIPVRSKSESVSLATRTLNYEKSFLTEDMLEWIDGFLLGDGSLRFGENVYSKSDKYKYCRFSMGSSQKEWTKYGMSNFSCYFKDNNVKIKKLTYKKDDKKHPNPLWHSTSLSHPDILKQVYRWYPKDFKKTIPEDVRITSQSVLLWYLGDGSMVNHTIKLATCSFTYKENQLLSNKLKDLNIDNYIHQWNVYPYIFIRRKSLGDFFNLIGDKSPIKCYDYKFNFDEWYKLHRLSDIFKDQKDIWRAQYFCKEGQVEFQKSPDGKFFLFNDDQKEKLIERMSKRKEIKLNELEIKDICERFKNNESALSISKRYPFSVKIVNRTLKENGFK